jgi:DNA-binding NtrC family response regulator
MPQEKILVVDDERNTRTTLEEALHPLGYEVVLASSGAEALERLTDRGIALVLLDLKMPGMGGLDVLRRIGDERPDVTVVILTAHGTTDSAVESMKHGALDVIQKPFSLNEIRDFVRREMDPGTREQLRKDQYHQRVGQAREMIRGGALESALAHLREAEALDPGRPDAFNLTGVISELRRDRTAAQKQYRIALDLDPTYQPAKENLQGSTRGPTERGALALGD